MSIPADGPDPDPVIWPRYEPKVAFMGDSRGFLAYDFPYIKNTLYNMGIGSSTTRSILKRLYRLDSIMPKYVFIFTGINDYQIPTSEFQANLIAIAKYISDLGIQCIITEQGAHPQIIQTFPQIATIGQIMMTIPNSYYLNVGYNPYVDFTDTIGHFNVYGYIKLANAMIAKFHGHKSVTV
jgi:lysophospholipase L1-like esterase